MKIARRLPDELHQLFNFVYLNERPLTRIPGNDSDNHFSENMPDFHRWLLRQGELRESHLGVSRSGLFTDFS